VKLGEGRETEGSQKVLSFLFARSLFYSHFGNGMNLEREITVLWPDTDAGEVIKRKRVRKQRIPERLGGGRCISKVQAVENLQITIWCPM
jgi:hypothetical protein